MKSAKVLAAAIIWFRIGEAAFAYSTVYDERMAALSLERSWGPRTALCGGPPENPGLPPRPGSPKRSAWSGSPTPGDLGSPAAVALDQSTGRCAAPGCRPARRFPTGLEAASFLPLALGIERALTSARGPSLIEAGPLELTPPVEMFLDGDRWPPKPQAMTTRWTEGDVWWRWDPPQAAVRISADGPPREKSGKSFYCDPFQKSRPIWKNWPPVWESCDGHFKPLAPWALGNLPFPFSKYSPWPSNP